MTEIWTLIRQNKSSVCYSALFIHHLSEGWHRTRGDQRNRKFNKGSKTQR